MIKTNNGNKGGVLKGKPHSKGGIKAIIADDNRPVELEGGEVIINKHAAKIHWKKLSEINQSEGNGVPIHEPSFKSGGNVSYTDSEKKEIYNKWSKLVNMSYSELRKFYYSEEGKKAGLTSSEAKKQGIKSGRESARWIMRMLQRNWKDWSVQMFDWANRQISFISRMKGGKGSLYDDNGNKTRKHLALLIWGHNPDK
jgi:hypothetical protein